MKTKAETTEASPKHTPTPWATDGRMIVQDAEGRKFFSGQPYIADCLVSAHYREDGSTGANARFIVRAVNSHEALLAALKDAAEVLRTAHQYFPKSIKNRDTFHLLNVEANSVNKAIALAEKEG